ncbi:MAG: CpaE family protein [Rhodomicrobiaceae bacterium]
MTDNENDAAGNRAENQTQNSAIPYGTTSGLARTRIDVFCEDAGTAETLAGLALDRRLAGIDFKRRMGGIHAARTAYAETPSPDLIIVETLLDASGILADMERLAEVCDAGTRVIVIGHLNDVLLYRELLRRDISDYLVAPVEAGQMVDAIRTSLKDEPAETLGRVIAFIGAKGGAGSSTVCHNTGWVLAEQMKAGTIIADFDLAFGTLGLDFNQDGGQGLADALAASYKLDAAMIGSLLAKCSDHLGLLTASYMLDDSPAIQTEDALRLTERLSQTVPFVLLDLPSQWHGWSRALIEEADDIVITAEPDLANLRNAKNLIDTARAIRKTAKPPILIMNRAGMPRRPEIALRDFANAVDLTPSATIGFDAQTFGVAANNGLMIGEAAPKSRHLELFRGLAGLLGGKTPARKTEPGLIRPIIERLNRRLAG